MSFKMWNANPWNPYPTRGSSLFVFGHHNLFRLFCYRIVTNPRTLVVWICAVIVNTALKAVYGADNNLGTVASNALFILQVALLVFFWIRCLTEIIALGLLLHPHAFFCSFWNVLEISLNVVGIIELLPVVRDYRWLRAFAVARPLRFFQCVPGFIPLLLPFSRGGWMLGKTLVFFLATLASLALVAVMLIGESLHNRCYITDADPNGSYMHLELPFPLGNVTGTCGVGFRCPILVGATVECRVQNVSDGATPLLFYSNMGSAMLRLFKVATVDNWYEDVEIVMNIRGGATVLLLICTVFISFFFFCFSFAIVHEFYTQTLSSGEHEVMFMAARDTDSFAHWRSKKKDVTVQTSDDEFMTPLPGRKGVADVQNSSLPSSLCNSFMMISSGVRGSRKSCFVPYSGAPPQRKFLEACCVNGIVSALRDQERTIYGPIYRGNVSWFIASLLDSSGVCLFTIFLSFLNVLLLVLAWEDMDTMTHRCIIIASAVCSACFLIPVSLKCLSFGPLRTLCDVWSVFDALSALSGIFELIAPHLFIGVVCGLRVLRILRLGKYVSFFRVFKRCHVSQFAYIVILIAVTLVLYAILGIQLFGDTYRPRGVLRGSFGNFWNALLTCFIAFTGDHWTDCMRGALETGTPTRGLIFFVSLYLITLLELNMLVSVMVGCFKCAMSFQARPKDTELPPLMVLPPYDPTRNSRLNAVDIDIGESARHVFIDGSSGRRSWVELNLERCFAWLLSSRGLSPRGGNSLFLFEPQCSARQLLLSVFGSMSYRLVIMVCIILSIVLLFFERRDNSAEMEHKLWVAHVFYTAFFICEMCLKWVAVGVIFPAAERDRMVAGPHMVAYFRDPCGWLDFLVNVVSLTGVFYAPFRVGRAIRAIRLLTSSEYPNMEFISLLAQLKQVCSVAPLIAYLFLVFSVLGMQFFRGKIHYCLDRDVMTRSACVGPYTVSAPGYTAAQTFLQERRWVTEPFTYDNFYRALFSVFALAVGSNWTALMYTGMDVVDENTALSPNHSAYYVVFFILAVVIIRFVALKFIVAIILAHLLHIYGEWGGFVTHRQQQQRQRERLKAEFIVDTILMDETRFQKHNFISRIAHQILTAKSPRFSQVYFHYLVYGVFLLNCLFLAMTTSPEPKWKYTMLFSIDLVGIIVCVVEATLRLAAYGPGHFCRSPWNAVDLIVLTLIILAAAVPEVSFMRVFRVVKLFKGSFVKQLLYLFFRRGKFCLFNALALCSLLLLVYAFIGVSMFGNVKLYDEGLTENRNFRTALRSILVMFQVATTNGWEYLMLDCAQDPVVSGCARGDTKEGCGSKISSVLFFTTYIILMLLFIQLVVALFAHVFTTQQQDQTTNAFLQVRRLWLEVVGPGKPLVDLWQLVALLPRVPFALTGLKRNAQEDRLSIMRLLSDLRLPVDSRYRVRYNDIIHAFVCKTFRLNLRREFCLYFSDKTVDFFTAAHAYAAAIIQRYWRSRRCAKETERLAMLDSAYRGKGVQNQIIDFSIPDFLDPLHTTREGGDIASEQPLRLHIVEQLPRGALAAPGSSLFMFDFLDSVCPRMQSPLTRFQTDSIRRAEKD